MADAAGASGHFLLPLVSEQSDRYVYRNVPRQPTESKLGSIVRPKSVDFIDALLRSAVGKVLERELRDRYWQGRSSRIWARVEMQQ
jgi:acyl-CoA synthetase (AMP-forming)/AMP-acid ligase II